jgi:hypothetical protein
MRLKATFAQLETRGRLRKLARKYGAPEATKAEWTATRDGRRRVLETLKKIAN